MAGSIRIPPPELKRCDDVPVNHGRSAFAPGHGFLAILDQQWIDDVPTLAHSGDECGLQSVRTRALGLAALCPSPCTVSLNKSRATIRAWTDGLARVASGAPHVHHWPLLHDALCDEAAGVCGPTVPGTDVPSHLDTNHLTHEASFWLWPHTT